MMQAVMRAGRGWSRLWLLTMVLLAHILMGSHKVAAQSSADGRSRLRLIFSISNWNKYSVGKAIDVGRDFSALMTGCTGAMRNQQRCSDVQNNVMVSEDPGSGSSKVMSVTYRRGAYASRGGAQWYTRHAQLEAAGSGMLEYQVFFPTNFNYNKGGKLPGMYGGNYMCSGSKVKPNGYNCFSSRLMWRENGNGESYLYVPITQQQDAFCSRCAFWPARPKCRTLQWQDFCSWNRGSFTFPKGQWTKVQQYVKINTPGKNNGVYQLYINGRLVMSTSQLYLRATNNFKLGGMLFSTFMGGDDASWAPKADQQTYFKNIKVYAGIN